MPDFYDILEKLGYTKAEKRLKIYEHAAKAIRQICRRNWKEDLDIEICGSRGEGIACSLDSDYDVLFIQRSVKCFGNNFHKNAYEDKNNSLFTLDFENVPNGYTKLRFESMKQTPDDPRNAVFRTNVKDALEEHNGSYYLTNNRELITAIEYRRFDKPGGWIKRHLQFDEISGPSRPFRFKAPFLDRYLEVDCVQAFPCHFPSLVEEWCTRKRKFDWPSKALIEEVKRLDVFVVPAGKKGSIDEALQWRVSMTLAERALVRSFNDTQIKIYAAVKIIVKEELKPICSEIKSYLVKNITFWVFEDTKLCEVTKENLDLLFVKILKLLRHCISCKNLQCYTMPSRNLLENKCTEQQTVLLLRHMDTLIAEGIFTLLRCPSVIELACQTTQSSLKLLLTELINQIILSIFSLSLDHADVSELLVCNAQSTEQIFAVYLLFVFPLIRATNPFGYFNLIKTLTNDQIVCLLLYANETTGFISK